MTKVTNYLIADVGGSNPEEALRKAIDLLHAKGWTVSGERIPVWVWMESPEWTDTPLVLSESRTLESLEEPAPELGKAIQGAREKTGSKILVIMETYPNRE